MNLAASIIAKNLILNRVEIIGASTGTLAIEWLQQNGSVTFNDLVISGTYNTNIIVAAATLGADSAMTVTVNGLNFKDVQINNAGLCQAFLLRKLTTSVFSVTCNISRVTGTLTNVNVGTSAGIAAIQLQGLQTPTVHSCDFTLSSLAGTAINSFGINVFGQDAVNRITNNARIYSNTVTFLCPAGDAISCGTDAETGLLWTTNPQMWLNVVKGINSTLYSPHGVVLRGVATGKAWNNIAHRLHSPFMLSLCTSDNVIMHSNLTLDCYGVVVSFKGNSGGIMANNTCVITPNSMDGSVTLPFGIWARIQAATLNTGGRATNNNILWLGVAPKTYGFAFVETSNALTFSGNNYYSNNALINAPFAYTGVTSADVPAWNATRETLDASALAMFSGTVAEIIAAFGNVSLAKLGIPAAMFGGGDKWWTGANPETLGEPLLTFGGIDRGAIGSSNSPSHPKNL